MKNRSKKIALFFIIALITFIIYGQIKSYQYEKELLKDGKVTIGRLDSIQENPKRSYLYMSYFIGNKKYSSFESDLHKKMSKKDIGKFYEVKYLSNSPEIIRGNYSKQIIDSIEILNAGFSIKDLELGNVLN